MTRRRRALSVAAVALGVLVVGVAACEIQGWPFLRAPLQRIVGKAAGVPVTLQAPFALHLLWRPRIEVGHIEIPPGAGVDVPHLLDGDGVVLGWRWLDLLRWRFGGPLHVLRLQADKLDLQLVRRADGHASWQIGHRDTPPPGQPADPFLPPRFGVLSVADGRIVVDDKVLDTDLLVTLRGREGDSPGVAGYEASVRGRYMALPLKLQVHSGGALPLLQDDDGGAAPSLSLRVQGDAGATAVFFDGQAADLLGRRRFDGTVRLSGPSLAAAAEPFGVTLPNTPPFELVGKLDFAPGLWNFRADRAAIGRSLLAGDFQYDQRTRPPRLTGRLSGKRLALADLGPAVGTPVAGAASRPAGGRVLPQKRFDLPSLRAMDADVELAIDELDLGTAALAPLRSLQARLLLQDAVLQLQKLHAVVAGGKVDGSSQLDARGVPAKWSADLQFGDVDIAGWIRAVDKPAAKAAAPRSDQGLRRERETARQGGDQPVHAYVTGVLTGEVKATGQGLSTADILGTLDGRARFDLRDGTVSHLLTEAAGLDIAQGLGVLVRGDRPLPLRCARLDLVMQSGVVRPRLAVLDNSDSTIRIGGQIDLRNETLALRAQTLPKDFSPMTLRTPVLIGGTLSAPKVGVEPGPLFGRVAGAVALGVLAAPVAALLPFIDPGSRQSGDPCAQSPPPLNAAARGPDKAAR